MLNKFIQYLKDSRQELKRVVWPSKKQTTNLTVLVVLISLGVAAFLGLIDWLLNLFMGRFVK